MLERSRADKDTFTAVFTYNDIDYTIVAILVDKFDGEMNSSTS